jgi:hypothetical protein
MLMLTPEERRALMLAIPLLGQQAQAQLEEVERQLAALTHDQIEEWRKAAADLGLPSPEEWCRMAGETTSLKMPEWSWSPRLGQLTAAEIEALTADIDPTAPAEPDLPA